MYAIFMSGSNYILFLSQFVPQELIEQATALLGHHPWALKKNVEMMRYINRRVLSKGLKKKGAIDAASPAGDDELKEAGDGQVTSTVGLRGVETVMPLSPRGSVLTALDNKLRFVGIEVAAREYGEDASFFIAAACAFPYSQASVVYTVNPLATVDRAPPTYDEVLVCLFLFALSIEHILSVSGIMAVERKGVDVTARYSKSNIQIVLGCAFLIMLLAAGEA
jgi:hypothetical protein